MLLLVVVLLLHGLPVIVRLCLRLRLSMPLRLYPYLYPYPWGWMGWDEYRRGAYRSRPSASAQRVDERRLAAQMWIVCFYIGPGLSEIRHQTPDGQEARKPVKKDRSTLPIISNPCCLQAEKSTVLKYIGGPQSHQSRSQSPAQSPVSPASPTLHAGRARKKKKTSSQDGF